MTNAKKVSMILTLQRQDFNIIGGKIRMSQLKQTNQIITPCYIVQVSSQNKSGKCFHTIAYAGMDYTQAEKVAWNLPNENTDEYRSIEINLLCMRYGYTYKHEDWYQNLSPQAPNHEGLLLTRKFTGRQGWSQTRFPVHNLSTMTPEGVPASLLR